MHSILAFVRKWTTLDIVFLSFYMLIRSSGAHILVYRVPTNQLIEEYNDLPAQFGPSLPSNGLKVYPIPASDEEACHPIKPPPAWRNDLDAKYVALIKRGGENCTFAMKVRTAQAAHFNAVIVYNNEGDDLEQMSAKNASGIYIPSVFVGYTTGQNLVSLYRHVVLVINDEMPFNINTQLILPFSILIGLCFLIMIFYMIYKCVREERRLRRYRLPKSMLKKLPITKFTKSNELSYDMCVICLEEFLEGDKLRVLPCHHPYHSHCIDPWLTENRRVCPICKRKVFTKGEVRSNRNRQSSLDSVTDTDDDTTPLLRPVNNVRSVTTAPTTPSAAAATLARATTRHGTFGHHADVAASAGVNSTADDENALLPQSNRARVNPFNLPPTSNMESNESRRVFSFASVISRLFRRRPPISIAAPPFPEEVFQDSVIQITTAVAAAAAAATTSTSIPISNNILNPNLCGSFHDDDDDDDSSPPHSIYEPIEIVAPSVVVDDSVFIQTPTQGGIGVAALPNPTNRQTRGPPTRRATTQQFLI